MEKKKEESPPRVPFGHPGLEIRHPLRGLGVQVINSKSIQSIGHFFREISFYFFLRVVYSSSRFCVRSSIG